MLILAALAAAVPFAGLPVAPVPLTSYEVTVQGSEQSPERRIVAFPERGRRTPLGPARDLPVFVSRGGTHFSGETRSGSITRNTFAARPDGFPLADDSNLGTVETILAEARAGTRTFTPVPYRGKTALRTDVILPPNECAALPERTLRVFLSPRTLMPWRTVERSRATGKVRAVTVYTYRRLNAAFPVATFAPPALGERPTRRNDRFIRVSGTAPFSNLPYTPRTPRQLPAGYRLAVSGSGPTSAITGPEGSIPSSPSLFAAVYRRGQERIDVTQRVATTDWPSSPFAGECGALTEEPVSINGVSGRFASGPQTVPHLYWRDGNVRHTISGPFPKEDLVAIAESLTESTR